MNIGSIITLLITNSVTLVGGLYATKKKFQSSTLNKSSANEVQREGIYARYTQQLVDTLEKVRNERDILNNKVNTLQRTVNDQSYTINQQNIKLENQSKKIDEQNVQLDKQNNKIDELMRSVDKLTQIITERGIQIEEDI